MVEKKVLVFWTNRDLNIEYLLPYVGLSYFGIGDLVYCPFHEDKQGGHKSAKVFKDAIHCFSESKQYRPYDILKFLGFSDSKIESRLRLMGKFPPSDITSERKGFWFFSDFSKQKKEFIKGRISFYEYTDIILDFLGRAGN